MFKLVKREDATELNYKKVLWVNLKEKHTCGFNRWIKAEKL